MRLIPEPRDADTRAGRGPGARVEASASTSGVRHTRGMSFVRRTAVIALMCALGAVQGAQAQENWQISAYPVLAWVPVGIGIDVEVPPGEGDSGGSGSIVDGRFDGAFFGGVSATNSTWRFDANVIWAAIGGDRVERPFLTVDADIIYGYGSAGRAVAKDVYITAGLRRVALNYDIQLADLPRFSRKPGVWDPLVGLGYHRLGEKLEVHGVFDAGGFGVGADLDLGASLRFDWKPTRHFGLAAGYAAMHLKLSDTLAGREFKVKQTMHGPTVGIGLYF